MTGIGCVLSLCLFVFVCCAGVIRASNHGAGGWLGLAFGLVAWFAAMCTYAAWLTILDRITARNHPNREDVPWWAKAIVWLLFLTSVPAAWWLFRRIS